MHPMLRGEVELCHRIERRHDVRASLEPDAGRLYHGVLSEDRGPQRLVAAVGALRVELRGPAQVALADQLREASVAHRPAVPAPYCATTSRSASPTFLRRYPSSAVSAASGS